MAIRTYPAVVPDGAEPGVEVFMQRHAIYFEESIFKLILSETEVSIFRLGIFACKKRLPGHNRIVAVAVVFCYQDGVIIIDFVADLLKVRRVWV